MTYIENIEELNAEFNGMDKYGVLKDFSSNLLHSFNRATKDWNEVTCSPEFFNKLFNNLTETQKRFISIALRGAREDGYDDYGDEDC